MAALAAVIALIGGQLLLVGSIVSGARDGSAVEYRLDTSRAFYAAEGGVNMALREVFHDTDEDGDGGIGSISSGPPVSATQIGTARVQVAQITLNGRTTLVGRSCAGITRRQVVAVIE